MIHYAKIIYSKESNIINYIKTFDSEVAYVVSEHPDDYAMLEDYLQMNKGKYYSYFIPNRVNNHIKQIRLSLDCSPVLDEEYSPYKRKTKKKKPPKAQHNYDGRLVNCTKQSGSCIYCDNEKTLTEEKVSKLPEMQCEGSHDDKIKEKTVLSQDQQVKCSCKNCTKDKRPQNELLNKGIDEIVEYIQEGNKKKRKKKTKKRRDDEDSTSQIAKDSSCNLTSNPVNSTPSMAPTTKSKSKNTNSRVKQDKEFSKDLMDMTHRPGEYDKEIEDFRAKLLSCSIHANEIKKIKPNIMNWDWVM